MFPNDPVCSMEGCRGELNLEEAFVIKRFCYQEQIVIPCKDCGRLYWMDTGKPVFRVDGKPAYVMTGTMVTANLALKEKEGGPLTKLFIDPTVILTRNPDERVNKILFKLSLVRKDYTVSITLN